MMTVLLDVHIIASRYTLYSQHHKVHMHVHVKHIFNIIMAIQYHWIAIQYMMINDVFKLQGR